jgi:hypothetical protein
MPTVKLIGSSRATTKIFFQLVAKNRSERHYIYERFSWRQWRPESSVRLLSQDAFLAPIKGSIRLGADQLVTRQQWSGGR